MVVLTVCLLALDATLSWLFSRYNAMWVRPAIMGGAICLVFLGVARAIDSNGVITFTVPSQSSIATSLALVMVYYGGRRLYKLYRFATGKARHPVQDFIAGITRKISG